MPEPNSTNTYVSTAIDVYIAQLMDAKTIWVVELSNGETVFEDDERPEVFPHSAWERLGNYCSVNNLHIVKMLLRNRSNVKAIEEDADGYFFCKALVGHLYSGVNQHVYMTGALNQIEEGGLSLEVTRWRVPELIEESVEFRDPLDAGICLIAKKGVLHDSTTDQEVQVSS